MYLKALKNNQKILAVAPMMDWSDRHCRYFHRLLSSETQLYTEMVVDEAILHGDQQRLLGFSPAEQPIALQLGGSDPAKLARAAKIGADWGYSEINLNVGCPSDRVRSGTFGACLMLQPKQVGRCVRAITDAVDIEVTVKCRLGVDDQDTETALDDIATAVFENGGTALWVHARKAWLQGLSPQQNRDIPPLDYGLVYALKQKYPDRFIGINGGITTLEQARGHFAHVDGVMIGRAAYHEPEIFRHVDKALFASDKSPVTYEIICDEMMKYATQHIQSGGRLNHITRHMLGLFRGLAGARQYRQIMSVEACRPGAGVSIIERAFAAVTHIESMAQKTDTAA